MKHRAGPLIVFAALTLAAPLVSQERGGVDLTGPYEVVPNWMKPIEEGATTYVVGVFADTPDRILVTSTGATPGKQVGTFEPKAPGAKLDHLLMALDANGKVTEEWRQWFPLFANSMHVPRINPYDTEKHVWVMARDNNQIFEFTHDGKTLVLTLGESGVAAADETHLGRPAEIAWLPDGTFFVADGYQNRRVVKFDRNGKFLKAWGSQGSAPGQFGGVVHCVAVDARRRVYVADPGNHRIQIFDEQGTFLDQWSLPSPMHIMVTQDQSIWVVDLVAQRLLKYNTEGELLTYWGTAGDFPGGFNGPHDFTVDATGNLYIDMGFGHRIEKYVPKPGVDPDRLVGQPFK
jgi:peptidylamidoglycolate lyase